MHRLIRSFIGGFSRNISLTTNLKNSPTTSISSTSNAPQKTSTYSTLPTPSPSDSVIASQPTDVGKVHRYDRVNYGYPTKTAAELLKLPYDQQFPENAIVVYTDASCVRQSATGIANYYGNSHPLNLSLRLNLQEHNSGKAEIYSTTIALHRLFYWKEYRGELVIIRTDYLATIRAMRYGNNGSFAMDYDNLRSVAAYFPLGVEFQWVKAHNGDPGNEMAARIRCNHRAAIGAEHAHDRDDVFDRIPHSSTTREKDAVKVEPRGIAMENVSPGSTHSTLSVLRTLDTLRGILQETRFEVFHPKVVLKIGQTESGES